MSIKICTLYDATYHGHPGRVVLVGGSARLQIQQNGQHDFGQEGAPSIQLKPTDFNYEHFKTAQLLSTTLTPMLMWWSICKRSLPRPLANIAWPTAAAIVAAAIVAAATPRLG